MPVGICAVHCTQVGCRPRGDGRRRTRWPWPWSARRARFERARPGPHLRSKHNQINKPPTPQKTLRRSTPTAHSQHAQTGAKKLDFFFVHHYVQTSVTTSVYCIALHGCYKSSNNNRDKEEHTPQRRLRGHPILGAGRGYIVPGIVMPTIGTRLYQ